MHHTNAQLVPTKLQSQRNNRVGNLATTAASIPRTTTANLSSAQTTLAEPQFKQNLGQLVRVIYIALLRILVTTIGYLHRLRQRLPNYLARSTSTSTHRSHAYHALSTAPSRRNHPLRSSSKAKTYNYDGSKYNYDDSAPSYDALHNLRRRLYETKEQSRLTGLNDMSQYRAYFVPGEVDPWGLCSDECAVSQWSHKEILFVRIATGGTVYEEEFEVDLSSPTVEEQIKKLLKDKIKKFVTSKRAWKEWLKKLKKTDRKAKAENLQIGMVQIGIRHKISYWYGAKGWDSWHKNEEFEVDNVFASKDFKFEVITTMLPGNGGSAVLDTWKNWMAKVFKNKNMKDAINTPFDPFAALRRNIEAEHKDCYDRLPVCKGCGERVVPEPTN